MPNPTPPTCPKCGSPNYEREMVDVGCGEIPAGPWGCLNCGYVEHETEMVLNFGADEEGEA